jgi:hypothetical protein
LAEVALPFLESFAAEPAAIIDDTLALLGTIALAGASILLLVGLHPGVSL